MQGRDDFQIPIIVCELQGDGTDHLVWRPSDGTANGLQDAFKSMTFSHLVFGEVGLLRNAVSIGHRHDSFSVKT